MNIFLVRHGQSMGNLDISLYKTTADHAIPLSDLGIPLPGPDLACDVPFIPPPDDQLPPPLQGVLPTIVPNTNTTNCTNDGYVTDNSWGYRVRSAAEESGSRD